MKGVLVICFGIVTFMLTLPSLHAQNYRVVWQNMITGQTSHGKPMEKDAAYELARCDNLHLAPLVHASVEKGRRLLSFIPLRPKRIEVSPTLCTDGNTPLNGRDCSDDDAPIKKDH